MFQQVINAQQAPGVEGDFASLNPFASVLTGPGDSQLVAPATGLKVGNFAWVGPAGQVSQSFVAGYQIGFFGNDGQGLITRYLQEASLIVPSGFPVTLFNSGDFRARFAAGATVGQNVFADPNDGAPLSGVTAPSLASGTASAGFSGTATLNSTAVVSVTAVTHGIINIGDPVTDSTTAGNIPAGATFINQLTGTAGGVGTYTISAAATASAVGDTIATTSSNTLVTAVANGAFTTGDVIAGTAVAVGTVIGAQALPFTGAASTVVSTTALTVNFVTPGTDLLRKGASVVMAGVTPGTTISSQTSGTPGGVGVYVLSANATATENNAPITTVDAAGQTGLYAISGFQTFGALAVPETITVSGTAQATPFKVRGTYSPLDNELGTISSN